VSNKTSPTANYEKFLTVSPYNCSIKAPYQRAVLTDDSLMCAYAGEGKGVCKGDSGGPLVY
jgi:hypothetical protein